MCFKYGFTLFWKQKHQFEQIAFERQKEFERIVERLRKETSDSLRVMQSRLELSESENCNVRNGLKESQSAQKSQHDEYVAKLDSLQSIIAQKEFDSSSLKDQGNAYFY